MSLEKWLADAKKDGVVDDKERNTSKKPQEEKKMEIVNAGSSPAGKEPIDILPKPVSIRARFGKKRASGSVVQQFRRQFPIVDEWLKEKGKGTQHAYAQELLNFCREVNMLPAQFGEYCHTKEGIEKARDMAWKVIQKTNDERCPHAALQMQKALKSFFRYYSKGDKLPFDTQKGGHHRIVIKSSDKRRQFSFGTIEQARDTIYNIINQAENLKTQTLMTFDFVTGLRANAFGKLKWKHLEPPYSPGILKVDGEEVLAIKITGEIELKMESYGFDFYFVFVSGSALRLFRRYEKAYRKEGDKEQMVFTNNNQKPLTNLQPNQYFKTMVAKAERKGLLPEGATKLLTFHKIRKLFRKFVRNSTITDDEFKEFIFGHVLTGAREAYAERDPQELAREYLKVNFEPPTSYLKEQLRQALEKKRELEATVAESEEIISEPLENQISEETLPSPQEGWQTPRIKDQTLPHKGPTPSVSEEYRNAHPELYPKETVIMTKTVSVQKVRENMKPMLERILKPAPKHCLRGKTFGPNDTDEYCHTVCAKQDPHDYQVCQEVQVENPEHFA